MFNGKKTPKKSNKFSSMGKITVLFQVAPFFISLFSIIRTAFLFAHSLSVASFGNKSKISHTFF
jgi:hypothetical protein